LRSVTASGSIGRNQATAKAGPFLSCTAVQGQEVPPERDVILTRIIIESFSSISAAAVAAFRMRRNRRSISRPTRHGIRLPISSNCGCTSAFKAGSYSAIPGGCTLALVYAETHAQRVEGLLLVGITMTRRSEIDWLYQGLGRFFPEQWARFRATVPEEDRDGDLVAAYYRLLLDPDPAIHVRAARDWHEWEGASILIDPRAALSSRWSDPHYLAARARIITHYFHHLAWLEERQILRDIHRLAGIPCTMIQGRMDLEAPLITAWELSQAWPEAELVVVANAAHSPAVAEMAAAIIRATDGLRRDFKR